MSQKYPGGFITKSPVAPTASAASGMWTLDQAMQLQKQGTWPSPPLVIGQAYAGGFYAGQISTAGNGVATHNLVIGPVASAESNLQYKTANTSGDPTSVIDGPTNSSTMNSATYPAAQFCEGLTIGGFSDWYMAALNEWEVCYYNLKPTTNSNSTSFGINANAVPARASNYTSGVPAQTSSANFVITTGAQNLGNSEYWSSTQSPVTNFKAVTISSQTGYQYAYNKATSRNVRAIRRVAV
jgi:hypothetical protein